VDGAGPRGGGAGLAAHFTPVCL